MSSAAPPGDTTPTEGGPESTAANAFGRSAASPSSELIGAELRTRGEEPLVEVRDLAKHFPITQGIIFQRKIGAVRAVDGVSFDVNRGETLGIVGETGCGKSTTARLIMRLLDATAGEVRFDGQDITHLKGARLKATRREMQMIFQDPYSSLNPRKTVGSIIGEPFAIHGLERGKAARRKAVHGVDGDRRAEPRALQPLPARVLGRPAPAHRRGARARAEAEAPDRRRARLRARRLDPGAGAQPAARPAADPRADARLHRARPLRRAPHVRPRRGDVPRQDRRDRRWRRALRVRRATPTPARCSQPCPWPTRTSPGPRSRRCAAYMPSPANPPSGCRFRTRCPKARPLCAEQEPPLEDKGTGTLAACHFPLTEQETEQIGVRSPR